MCCVADLLSVSKLPARAVVTLRSALKVIRGASNLVGMVRIDAEGQLDVDGKGTRDDPDRSRCFLQPSSWDRRFF